MNYRDRVSFTERGTQQTMSVMFSLQELWFLQSCVRHDTHQSDAWKFPPASLDLNDQIALGIVFCIENKMDEAPILLSRGDCLVIDFVTPQDAKDVSGVPIGRNILVKSFKARALLLNGEVETTKEPSSDRVFAGTAQASLDAFKRLTTKERGKE